jgi:hypothetical protein
VIVVRKIEERRESGRGMKCGSFLEEEERFMSLTCCPIGVFFLLDRVAT